jgi:hypothetical protein
MWLTMAVNTLIIDDNWQSLDNDDQGQGERGMTEFEANKKGFPNGLKSTLDTIKRDNPGITHVAVWHTMVRLSRIPHGISGDTDIEAAGLLGRHLS